MGCEHERIHLETSSVLFRQLPSDQVKAVPMWSACTQFRACAEDVPENELLPVPEGDVVAGKTEENQESYGWDNEYGSFSAHTSSFRASKFLCSNSEFSEFVRSGGYEDPTLWGEEGWKFVQFRKAQAPVFWVPVEQQVDSPADQQHSSELPKKDGSALAQTGGKSEDKTASPPRAPVTYRYRTMTTIIDMPWDWPVDCNYIEAKAWCTWKNRQRKLKGEAVDGLEIRMPSEAEYLRFREHAFPTVDPKTGVKNDQPYWTSAPGNINMEHGLSSCPIDTWRFEHGFYDVIGNVWQWTETPIMPLRGFKFHPLYDDFSVPTFDTRHNIFCGGSWASTGNEATRAARYAFRRHFYQHAGFRYILAAPLPITDVATTAMCETDPAVTLMMDAQFNDAAAEKVARQLGMKMQNYSVRFAELAVAAYKAYGRTGSVHSESKATGSPSPSSEEASSASPTSPSTTLLGSGPRALDLGCACGRSTFEIAKLSAPSSTEGGAPLFDHILGLDFSTRFIRIAAQLQFEQHAEYSMKKEGELISYHSIESKPAAELSKSAIPEDSSVLDLDLVSRGMQERVEFMQADACNLGAKYTGFDLVLAANLLDYLYSPAAFLTSISSRMRRGGILVLASSYSWDEAYTPRDQWLGGRKDGGGESVESSRTISELLSSQFEAISEASQEVPMMWKQNARNFQIKIAHTTVWRKL
jgi:5-histidylcysteine sulfoxide synthase/putative 4-mercaptohistidine N1-methyltranferase